MANKIVYSTESGDLRKSIKSPYEKKSISQSGIKNDGTVRVQRETKGRAGKTATVIYGIPNSRLNQLASELKQLCGAGGTVKDGTIIIQGDKSAEIINFLSGKNFTVKKSG